jgi:hypothetical protein
VLGPSILPPAGSPGRLGGSPGRISGEESEAWANSASSASMARVVAWAAPWRRIDFELGRVLWVGIWILAPQNGQIPRLPAWNSLTFSLCPLGQKNRMPIDAVSSRKRLL